MKLQKFQILQEKINDDFNKLKQEHPERLKNRLKLSWSNWTFGAEELEASLERLSKAGVKYIELGGNHFGDEVGYRVDETKRLLKAYGIECSGICGFYGEDNALSSNRALVSQQAIDYIRRETEFCRSIGGSYLLIVPGKVGTSIPYDSSDVIRSVNTLKIAAKYFEMNEIKGAIEPIRSAEVPIIRTVSEAKEYIKAVGHPSIQYINGDVFHMLSDERSVADALLEAGDMLINLHMEDSNRKALGEGCMDVDTIIKVLYIMDYNNKQNYVTFEPLGPGGDSYQVMYGLHPKDKLDRMVVDSVNYFREREDILLL